MTDSKNFAVLFDLDGTLLDSIGLLLECMEFAFAGRRVIPSRERWTAGIGTPLRVQMRDFAVEEHELESVVERYRVHQHANLERLTTLFPGAMDVVQLLRASGVKTGVVTSKGRGMTLRSLAHVGLADAFDVVVTADDTTRHKPDPLPVEHALYALGLTPDRALFVGDSTHDMASGRAAGTATGAALWGPFTREQLEAAGPTYWLRDVGEVPAVVGRLW
jgi:pyrophosphatase PpaX